MPMETKRTPTGKLITLLDAAENLPGAGALRLRSYDLLGAEAGTSMVDVGCGAGRAVADLAERSVRAVGVDPDEQMIAVARDRWPEGDFRLAGAYELPIADASMAGYRADKVFHVLAEPERALAEARRVLAPGGRIVLVGQDWDTVVIDSGDPALTRTIVHARADLIPNPQIARRYRNLLLDAGFQDVTAEVHTGVFTGPTMLPMLVNTAEGAVSAGAVTREQADGWIAEQRTRAETDHLFLALPMFLAAGTAPT
ncbi:methyltransferase domain-containing protein [Actinomadura darangshiensis]|uniref:Methyltransferase domain-containing protein n=1 Tax=Actinomadura darangshiensis TaxID=705336 RepID=A0A4R5AUK8_9ACTN|nr:methyltransferase domain-containing protein [Actinomadura darangshiensis]TDD74262.1 methyltransferase domain-containing protein [Actinomadura darangshiensis]